MSDEKQLTREQMAAVARHRMLQTAKRTGTLYLVGRSFIRDQQPPPNTLAWRCSDCGWTYKIHRVPPIEEGLDYHLARNAFDVHDCEHFREGEAA